MRKNYITLMLVVLSAFMANAQNPIITSVVDACGSDAKFVEIYASGTIDFADYKLVRRSNDNEWIADGVDIDLSTLGSRTDEFVYVGRSIATLSAEFPGAGISASNAFEDGNISHNGDDSYRIVEIAGDVVIDQFGGDTDGTGEPWEYTDSWGSRNNSEGPNPNFTISEWTFNAVDSLDDVGICNGASPLEDTVTTVASYTPAETATGPTTAPSTPTQEQEDVVSVYGDEFTGSTSFTATTFGVPGNNSTGELQTFASNEVLKITYDGGDFIGLQFDEPIDATEMEFFHVDVWVENPVPIGAVFILKWSNHAGGHLTGETDSFTSTQPLAPDQGGQWVSLDIPLTSEGFPNVFGNGLDARSILSELVINSASSEGTFGPFYYDNFYFWKEPAVAGPTTAPSTPTQEQEDVVSVYGDEYTGSTSFTATTFGVPGNNSTGELQTFASNEVLKITYDGGDFIGLQFDEPIDASAMENFHVDVWIENPIPIGSVFILKWSNHAGGHLTGETDSFTSTQPVATDQGGQWISLDIPLNSEGFPNQSGNGIEARSILSELVINSASSEGTFGPFYYDNFYFWKEPAAAGDCSATGSFTYEDDMDISNSLNGFVADNPDDYITLTFTEGSTESCCDQWFINDAADGTGNTIASGFGSIVGSYESITGEISFYVESDGSITGTTFVYELSCTPPPSCPAPTALATENLTASSVDLTWTAGGSETEWEVLWGEEGFDPEAEGTLINDDDGVLGVSLSELSAQTAYDAYVRAVCSESDVSEWSLINFTTPIAAVVVAPGTPESEAYCYDNDDFEEWLFESSNGSPLVIEFLQGSVEDSFSGTFDDLVVYDGQDDTGAILFDSDDDNVTALDLTGLILTADSGFMYITLTSDGSVSCADGDETEIQFEVSVFEELAYCTPVEFPNGCTDDNIDSFEIPAASFSHLDTGCSEGTYGDFTSDESLEINLEKSLIYDFSITHNWNAQRVKMWVDYNLDGEFDESEILFVSESNSGGTSGDPDPTIGTFVIPATVSEGTTRLRVITRFNNEPLDPCDPTDGATSAWGEVHDYTVNILPAPSCVQPTDLVADNLTPNSVDLTWTPGGSETEWEVLWGEAGFDPETEGTLINDDDGILGVTLTTLSPETSYDVYVRAVCDDLLVSAWSFINFTTPIAPVIVNAGVVESDSYCYENNDFKEWLFASFDGSPLTIEFLQGSVEDSFAGTFDDLVIYDGQDDTGVILFDSDEDNVTALDLTGLTLTADSGFIYMTLTTDGSVSCSEGDETEIQFEVSIQTIGTSQFDTNNFSFYPNPASELVNFETTRQVEQIVIYNIQGQKVILETVDSVSPRLNVGNLQTGTYIMSVTIDGLTKSFKLIKK